jgi:hypothetical protein
MAQSRGNDINKLVQDAEKAVRDGAYVALGFGILGFQQAQVRRRELTKLLSQRSPRATPPGQTGGFGDRVAANASVGRTQLTELAKTVDARLAPVRHQIDEQVDALEQTLSPTARKAVGTDRAVASVSEARLRSLVGLES